MIRRTPSAATRTATKKIGEGFLGEETFARIVHHPKLWGKPMILETPNELDGYTREIALLRALHNNFI